MSDEPLSRPQEYAWEDKEELKENTGYTYPGEAGMYLGAVRSEDVKNALEKPENGEDPTGTLEADQIAMGLEDLNPNQGLYALDIDRKQANNGQHNLFVQLVGTEDGGLYLTRQDAADISEVEMVEKYGEVP